MFIEFFFCPLSFNYVDTTEFLLGDDKRSAGFFMLLNRLDESLRAFLRAQIYIIQIGRMSFFTALRVSISA